MRNDNGFGLSKGQRVELHPSTGAWMKGDRFGEIESIGRTFVHVRMDRSRRTLKFFPHNVTAIDAPPAAWKSCDCGAGWTDGRATCPTCGSPA